MTIGNKGYVGTGVGAGSGNDFWKYDPLTNQWTQRADVPGTPRLGAFGFSMAGKGYLGGGQSGFSGPYLLDFHEYRDYDCFGVAGGDAHPGTACDDGDECTEGDVLTADCTCAGTVLDMDGDGDCDAIDPCPLADVRDQRERL
jgi:hypothetical protein